LQILSLGKIDRRRHVYGSLSRGVI